MLYDFAPEFTTQACMEGPGADLMSKLVEEDDRAVAL